MEFSKPLLKGQGQEGLEQSEPLSPQLWGALTVWAPTLRWKEPDKGAEEQTTVALAI